MIYTDKDIYLSFSALTDYPASLPLLEEGCRTLEKAGFNVAPMAEAVKNLSGGDICEHFTGLFDFDEATAPYAAFHAFSCGKSRAAFMAALSGMYGEAGFARAGGELPDHIPSLLAFIGTEGEAPAAVIEALAAASGKIALAAEEKGSFYGCVYKALADFTAGRPDGE